MKSCDNKCSNCVKVKHRSEDEKKKINNRLNKILGQVKGISKMVDENRHCNDILIQISAVDNSLKSLGNEILKSHLKTCVVDEIKKDNLDVIDEVTMLFDRIR